MSATQPEEEPDRAGEPAGPLAVLLVEDDPGDGHLFRRLLSRAEPGWDISVVPTLGEALAVLADRPIDCVILDLNLPDVTGLQGLRRVRQEPDAPPVVVLTGSDDDATAVAAVAAGAADYLPKRNADAVMLRRAVRYAVTREALVQKVRDRSIDLATIVEAVSDAVLLLDADGTVTHANRSAADLLGGRIPDDGLVGTCLLDHDLPLARGDGSERITTLLHRCLTAGIALGPVTLQWTEGPAGWVELRATPGGHAQRRLVVTLRDVTRERREADGLRRAGRLQALLTDVNELILRSEDAQLLPAVCTLAVGAGGFDAAWIGLPGAPDALAGGDLTTAARAGRRPDPPGRLLETCRRTGGLALADRGSGRRWAALPFHTPRRGTGVLALAHRDPEWGGAQERALLVELAADLGHGLSQLRLAEERREAVAALQASEERYRTIVETAQEGILLVDAHGRIAFANGRFADLAGRPAAELPGRPVAEVLPALAPAAAAAGTHPHTEVPLRQPDGSERWVRVTSSQGAATGDAQEGDAATLLCMVTDVTEERAAHRQLRFQADLLSAVGEAVIATDTEGVVQFWNAAATALYGWEQTEALGRHVADLIPVIDPPELGKKVWDELAAGRSWAGEVRLRRRDGTTVPVFVSDSPVLDDGGRLAGIIGVSFDVSERLAAAEEAASRSRQHAAVATLGLRALGLDLEVLFGEAVTAVREGLGADATALLLPDLDGRTLRLRQGSGHPSWLVGTGVVPAEDGSLAGLAMRSAAPVMVEDLTADPRITQPSPLLGEVGPSALAVPVMVRGRPAGVLVVQSARPRSFTADEVHFVQSVANVLSGAVEHEESTRALERLALEDTLTGLPNRALLLDRLQRALERQAREPSQAVTAVLFGDVDRLKLVNDGFGHLAGDDLLVAVADRLRRAARPGDTVARLGGDEFVLLCEALSGPDAAVALADRLAAAVSETPVPLRAGDVFVTLSMGVAVARDAMTDAHELLRDADAAMYRAKEAGGDRTELFDASLRAAVVQRLELANALRQALARDELRLVYQPEVELVGRRVWVEALMRWDHPQLGPVPPSTFIPLAEEIGLIGTLGEWALRTAVTQLAGWQAADPVAAPESVSVNVSPRQLVSGGLPAAVCALLAESGLPAEALWLEITETAVLEQPDRAIAALSELADLGTGLAIDDFGTGFSSLSYARRLPADALKIDRSFVSGVGEDLRDRTIVEAVIGLAHALGILAIAEGVETSEQEAALRRLGCDFAQGYRWSRPLEAAQVPAWVAAHRRHTVR